MLLFKIGGNINAPNHFLNAAFMERSILLFPDAFVSSSFCFIDLYAVSQQASLVFLTKGFQNRKCIVRCITSDEL